MKNLIIYGFIGIFNTGVHGSMFMFMISFGQSQAISNLIAFMISVTSSFILNAKLNFRKRPTLRRYIKMVFFMAILSYFGGVLGDLFDVSYILTFLAWSITSFIVGFFFNKYMVFSDD